MGTIGLGMYMYMKKKKWFWRLFHEYQIHFNHLEITSNPRLVSPSPLLQLKNNNFTQTLCSGLDF
jgi:hypothetical protein